MNWSKSTPYTTLWSCHESEALVLEEPRLFLSFLFFLPIVYITFMCSYLGGLVVWSLREWNSHWSKKKNQWLVNKSEYVGLQSCNAVVLCAEKELVVMFPGVKWFWFMCVLEFPSTAYCPICDYFLFNPLTLKNNNLCLVMPNSLVSPSLSIITCYNIVCAF